MEEQPLSDFVAPRGQPEAARLLGVSQSAISSMILTGRQVFVTADPGAEHGFSAYEIKPVKSIDRTGKKKPVRKKVK